MYKFLTCLDRCEEAMLKESHNTLYLERRQLTSNQHQDLSYKYSNFIHVGVWFNDKEGRDILSLLLVHALMLMCSDIDGSVLLFRQSFVQTAALCVWGVGGWGRLKWQN